MLKQIPKYRLFWTWDYCTFWDDTLYVRGTGATGVNNRRTHFLKDYKRMVDYCAGIGVNGIVIWGALRAHNDGIEQFRELIKYGKQKGVRILPGVGIFSYGGVVYDPRKGFIMPDEPLTERNPYSLPSWLMEHPELASIGPDGNPRSLGMFSAVACPSKKENMEWFKRSLEWLCTEFEVEGAQVEVGDYAVCHCDECKKRRKGSESSVFMVEDMIEPYTAAYEVMKKANPDSWVICETYSSFATPKTDESSTHQFGAALNETQKNLLKNLPSDAIFQWVMDRAVKVESSHDWKKDEYIPTPNNITRIHAGSQWHPTGIDGWEVYEIGNMVKKARESGINGVSIFGEESPASPPNEANYLVFSEFSGLGNENPDCDFDLFYKQTLDPLYGEVGMAEQWKNIYKKAHDWRRGANDDGINDVDKQKETVKLAKETHDISSKLSGNVLSRWAWLENWLWRTEFLYRTSIK